MKTLALVSVALLLIGACASPKFEDGKEMFASLERHDATYILVGKVLANTILIPIYAMAYLAMIMPDIIVH